jgi:hypothetical protein
MGGVFRPVWRAPGAAARESTANGGSAPVWCKITGFPDRAGIWTGMIAA